MFEQSVRKYADRPAFTAVGVTLSYRPDTQSRTCSLAAEPDRSQPGDRIAVQMPNITQYPWLSTVPCVLA